jgi:hypothetical protein
MLEATLGLVNQLNNNKVFWGITMILMNLGSRYVVADLSKIYENVLVMDVFKKLVLFCMFFIGSRDVLVAIALTFGVSILFQALLNANSRYTILPLAIKNRILSKAMAVSVEDYRNALEVVGRYEAVPHIEQFNKGTSNSTEPIKQYKELIDRFNNENI